MRSVGSLGGPAGVGGWDKAMGGVRGSGGEDQWDPLEKRKRNETVTGSAKAGVEVGDWSRQDRDRGKDVV